MSLINLIIKKQEPTGLFSFLFLFFMCVFREYLTITKCMESLNYREEFFSKNKKKRKKKNSTSCNKMRIFLRTNKMRIANIFMYIKESQLIFSKKIFVMLINWWTRNWFSYRLVISNLLYLPLRRQQSFDRLCCLLLHYNSDSTSSTKVNTRWRNLFIKK